MQTHGIEEPLDAVDCRTAHALPVNNQSTSIDFEGDQRMQRFLGSIVTALVSGGLCFVFTIGFLMDQGLRKYDNYEYYGGHWWAYCGAGLIGLFIPAMLAWILRRLSTKRDS